MHDTVDAWTRADLWADADARLRKRHHWLAILVVFGLSSVIFGLEQYALYELVFDGNLPTCVEPHP